MLGVCTTLLTPSAPMATNQRNMIGPNTTPTLCVPKRWARKRAMRTTSEIGTTADASPGATSSKPSTALSTDIAGVMMLSP